MKVKITLIVLFCLILVLPLTAQRYRPRRTSPTLSLSLSGGFSGSYPEVYSPYSYTWGSADYDIYEEGLIESYPLYDSLFSGGISLEANLMRYFGVSVSAAYWNAQMDLYSDYVMTVDWWDNTSNRLTGEGVEPGSVSVLPLSFNLFFTSGNHRKISIKLYGGLTLFFLHFDLLSQTGWGDMYEDDVQYGPEWYAIDVEIFGADQIWGGNLGGSIENRLGRHVGLFAGVEYYFAPEQEYLWTAVPSSYYSGQMGWLDLYETPDIHVAGDITTTLNISSLRIYAGIKLYL